MTPIHITVDDEGAAARDGYRDLYVRTGPDHELLGMLTAPPDVAAELAARVAAGEPHVEAITPTIAAQVLWYCGVTGGLEPGDFIQALIRAIGRADRENARRMAAVYPGYVLAMDWAKTEDGVRALRAIAGQLVLNPALED